MKLSLLLMVALAFVLLQAFVADSEAATRRLQRRPTALRTGRAQSLAATTQRRARARSAQRARAARARSGLKSRRRSRRVRPSPSQKRPPVSIRRTARIYVRRPNPRPRPRPRPRLQFIPRIPVVVRQGRQEDVQEVSENEVEEVEEVPEEEIMDLETLEEVMKEGPADAIEAEAMMEALEDAMEDPEKRQVVDANGDGVPDWCNPVKPMGAWLNFKNMRLWCADRGWTNFGPYGGVPQAVDAKNQAASRTADISLDAEEPVEADLQEITDAKEPEVEDEVQDEVVEE